MTTITWHDNTLAPQVPVETTANSTSYSDHAAGVHIGHLLEQIAQAARQVGPAKHGSLAYDVLSALVAGGVDRELVGCVLEEVG